jgi:rod shape-determining protein MreC
VPSYAGPAAARPGDIAGTLRLLAYLAVACALIVLDHRGGWLSQARQQAQLFVQPLWAVAGWPGQVVDSISDDAGTRSSLIAENRRLRNELLVNGARIARLQAATADNERMRAMLGVVKRGGLTCSSHRSSTSTSIPPASASCSMRAAPMACTWARS